MKRVREQFHTLSVGQKVQLMAALLVTIALLIAVPVTAWLSYRREAIKMMKVDSPNELFLSAAHREVSMNLRVDGINADEFVVDGSGNKVLDNQGREQKITHKDYVFSVTGEAVDEFTIQLAYTTNNPFTYEVYAAEELISRPATVPNREVDYVEYDLSGRRITGMPEVYDDPEHAYHEDLEPPARLYYKIDETVTEGNSVSNIPGKYDGTYLNLNTATGHATSDYHTKTYASYNNVQTDAEPVYWQATGVSAFPGSHNVNKKSFSRHFIIRVSWPAGSLNNTAKETDIVYLTIKATR